MYPQAPFSITRRQDSVDDGDSGYPTISIPDKVNIVTWFLLVFTCLAVLTRLGSKWSISKKLGRDDYLISVAALLNIGEVVATSLQTPNGLGLGDPDAPPIRISRFEKATYAADLLYVPILCLTKLSILMFLNQLSPNRTHQRLAQGIGAVVILWASIGFIVAAFQCHVPDAWAVVGERCIDRVAFWSWFGVLDILTDAVIVALPGYILFNLQMKLHPKVVAFAGFASRIVVIIATICRLAYLNTAAVKSNPVFGLWTVVVCTQSQVSLGIITACVPYLKPFLAGLSLGALRNDDLRRRAGRGKAYQAVPGTGIHAFFEEETTRKSHGERGPPVPPKDLPSPPVRRARPHQERVMSRSSRYSDGDFLDTASGVSGTSPGVESLESYRSDYIILPHERNGVEDSIKLQTLN